VVSLALLAQSSFAVETPENLRLTLPPEIFAVVGVETGIYFDNIVLTQNTDQYRFEVSCPVGQTDAQLWSLTATLADIGSHSLRVTVRDAEGTQLAESVAQLHITAANSGSDREVTMLVVGDSLTHATLWPNELARLLRQPGNPVWKMPGSHRPKNAAEGVAHEGYGGWTWQRFANHYEPNPDGTYRKRSSPFVFLDKSEMPVLDVARYFDETNKGERPDVVFFLLGINDCFSANPDDITKTDAKIATMLTHAETLLSAFQEAAPNADLAICITTPPNSRKSAFEENYKGRYPRWGWKRIQHRLVERLLECYESQESNGGSESGQLFAIPTHLYLDPTAGYPDNNSVHPNSFGYQQIGSSAYSWLKWWLEQQE
jgi:lysophospholipase L1-like esterase